MSAPLNPYAPPKARVDDVEPGDGRPEFYIVGMKKFYWLYLCTFGGYALYWAYRNWKAQKEVRGSDVWPVARAIFMVFFVYDLFQRAEGRLKERGAAFRGGAGLIATGIIAMVFAPSVFNQIALANGMSPFKLLLIPYASIPVLAMLFGTAQRNINGACGDPDGTANADMTGANWTWVAVGALYALLVLWGMVTLMSRVQH